MTEFTIPLEAFEQGAVFEPLPNGTPKGAYLDAERGVFVTSTGSELTLRPIPSLILERLYNATAGKPEKPKVPMVEVTIGKSHKTKEENPNDPDYKAALEQYEKDLNAWEQAKGTRIMMYLLTAGVAGTPPEEFVTDHRFFFPDATTSEMKYIWVASQIPDDDLEALNLAITGQTKPTAKGLEESANFTASPSADAPPENTSSNLDS